MRVIGLSIFPEFFIFSICRFDENMIETLFGYAATDKGKSEQKKNYPSQDPSPQFIQIIDPKKSQNLAILLRALNMTIEEVCDALREGKTSFLFFSTFQCNRTAV